MASRTSSTFCKRPAALGLAHVAEQRGWEALRAPLMTEVTDDRFFLLGDAGQVRIPNWPMPKRPWLRSR